MSTIFALLRQLDFRSFFTFLGRNRLYTAINVFGLSLSLMFVILIADYTFRQLTVDKFHTKADRIYVITNEQASSTAYYLQKYLRDRYPEIESTCAVSYEGKESSSYTQHIARFSDTKAVVSVLYADSTFFRFFDFELVGGDRRQAFATPDNVVISQSLARQLFAEADPVGQALFVDDKSFIVGGVMRDIDRSIIPPADLILRGELLAKKNKNDERMSNAGSCSTFLLERKGADLRTKIPDMLDYLKEIYWMYKEGVAKELKLEPLRKMYFSQYDSYGNLLTGNRTFVTILFVAGAVILLFAVINYINLTAAQTGFRAKEMATRRLLGASKREIVIKLILESTLMCCMAFLVAVLFAEALEPYAAQLLGSKIDISESISPQWITAYVLFLLVLGSISGAVPATIIARCEAIDVMRGSLRRQTKQTYSKVLIVVQNILTVLMLSGSLTVYLQTRHLIEAPLGYETKDILSVHSGTLDFSYNRMRRFRDELRKRPEVEAVSLSYGTPLTLGTNLTIRYESKMISFERFVCDSVFFRILGIKKLRDNHINGWAFNQYAFKEMGIPEDATSVRLADQTIPIAGVFPDIQFGSILEKPTAMIFYDIDDFDRFWDGKTLKQFTPSYTLIKTRGDQQKAREAVQQVFEEVYPEGFFEATFFEQMISDYFAQEQRSLQIIELFTFAALLISALGLLAMSTYYIQQKEQETAIRKVFGASRREILRQLVGKFMLLVAIAFIIAVPIAWYILDRWLQEYSVRIRLGAWIFLAVGTITALVALLSVFGQSRRAADANPIDTIKN